MSPLARHPVRFVVVQLAALLAIHAPGCSDHDDAPKGPADIVYQGRATDEGLATLLAAPTTVDAARAPSLTTPANGAKLPGAPPPAFVWSGATARVSPSTARTTAAARGLPLGPIRSAHAHGAAMNGPGYLLTLTSGGKDVVRVFTTETSYTPDATAWQKLVAAKSIGATITTASFDNNNVVAGPFAGATTSFTIEP